VSETWRLDHPWATVYTFGMRHRLLAGTVGRVAFGTDLAGMYDAIAAIRDVPAGGTVLDVPCGGGVALSGLVGAPPLRYLAADISPMMLRRTARMAARLGVTIETLEADVAALPLEDRSVDLCLSLTGLHCFPDPRAAVRELARPLLGYALTFALAGMFWMLQHRKFLLIGHSTLRHTWLTLVFLFWVSLLPFTVSLWVRTMSQPAGLTLYYANMALIAASLLVGWLDACHSGLATEAPAAARTRLTFRIGAMTAGCVGATLASFVYPPFSSVVLLVIVVFARVLARRVAPEPTPITP